MATIGLIRHGVTSWNKEGRSQGSSEVELDQEGIRQAERLAERLRDEEWDYLYSSNLSRAQHTARIVGAAIGKQVFIDQRLQERSGGQIEGTTESERIARWGDNWKELDLGIEPIAELQRRGSEFLEEIRVKHRGSRVLVVSHGSLIHYNVAALVPDYSSALLDNTSITIIRKLTDRWVCDLHNCTRHLH